MIRIHIFHTGSVIVDCAIPYKEKNPLAVTGMFRSADKKLTLPVSCYLIEHPKGRILIDSGWDTKYAKIKCEGSDFIFAGIFVKALRTN